MSTVVAAYQPRYFPRLHYVARAQQADVFIIYDDVQFSRKTPQHRAHIDDQSPELLTIPIRHTGVDTLLTESVIDMSTPWMADHLDTLTDQYGEDVLELKQFYESLVPSILDPQSLRESNVLMGEEHTQRLAEFRAQETKWREIKQELDRLRARKNELSATVAERKRADQSADISLLVEESKEIQQQIQETAKRCESAKHSRDQILATLSSEVETTTDLDWLSLRSRWELDGIEMDTLAGKTRLVDLTIPILEELFDRFQVTSRIVRSSQVDVHHPGNPSEYLARLTERFDGEYYLSGRRGYENYVEDHRFIDRDIELLIQDWEPSWPDGNVCALDVLYTASEPEQYIR